MEHRFAADFMVGGLAKWLRLLGFDTAFLREGPLPPQPGRILLTKRSTRPHQPRLDAWEQVHRLTANDTRGQVAEVIRTYRISRTELKPLTLCSVCNLMLEPLPPVQAASRIPPYVLATQTRFMLCPSCRRIYWAGTHHDLVMAMIDTYWPPAENGYS